MQTYFLCEKAYRFTNAKTYVFSNSVLCVGKMGDDPVANWKRQIQWYSENNHFKEVDRIDGMHTEFEWEIFSGITSLGLLEKIQKLMTGLQCEPEHLKCWIIFMSMFNDIVWDAEGNKDRCEYNLQTVAKYAREFPRGHWSFLERGSEEKWYGTCTHKPDGSWDRMAGASSPFARGELRRKEGRRSQYTSMVVMKSSSCFSAQSFLRISSVSTGAIADLCNEVPKDLGLRRNLQRLIIWKRCKSLPYSLKGRKFYQRAAVEKPAARIRAKIRTIVGRPEVMKIVF